MDKPKPVAKVLEVDIEKGGAGSEEQDAAQDALDAIKANDAKAFDMALQRHYELCQAKHGESEDDDEEEEEPAESRRY